MHFGFVFDGNSVLWTEDFEFNKLFARSRLCYLMDLYRINGYLYLNHIYECFGVMWNPYEENTCWISERDGELELSMIYDDNSCEKISIDILSIPNNKD